MAAKVATADNAASRRRQATAGRLLWQALAVGLLLWLAAAPPVQADTTPDQVREIEELLVRLGFTPGRVDGIADAETEAAIRDYQSFASLPVTGLPSQALLDELRGVMDAMPAVQEGGFVAPAPLPANTPAAQTATLTATQVAVPSATGSASQAASQAAPRSLATIPGNVLLGLPEKPPPEPEVEGPAKLAVVDAVGRPAAGATAANGEESGASEEVWEFALHLASFKEPGGIRQEWERLQHQLPSLLGDMTPRVHRVTLKDQDVLFRLYAGPFPTLATANELCILISKEGYRCGVEDRAAKAPAPTTQLVALALDPATAGKLDDLGPALVVAAGTRTSGLSEGELAARSALAQSDFESATAAFRKGDCQSAVRLYGRAFQSGGLPLAQLIAGRNNRGRCLFDGARYDEALADFDLAIELEPEFAAAYFNRGRVHKAQGNELQAEEDLRRAYDLGFGRLGDTP